MAARRRAAGPRSARGARRFEHAPGGASSSCCEGACAASSRLLHCTGEFKIRSFWRLPAATALRAGATRASGLSHRGAPPAAQRGPPAAAPALAGCLNLPRESRKRAVCDRDVRQVSAEAQWTPAAVIPARSCAKTARPFSSGALKTTSGMSLATPQRCPVRVCVPPTPRRARLPLDALRCAREGLTCAWRRRRRAIVRPIVRQVDSRPHSSAMRALQARPAAACAALTSRAARAAGVRCLAARPAAAARRAAPFPARCASSGGDEPSPADDAGAGGEPGRGDAPGGPPAGGNAALQQELVDVLRFETAKRAIADQVSDYVAGEQDKLRALVEQARGARQQPRRVALGRHDARTLSAPPARRRAKKSWTRWSKPARTAARSNSARPWCARAPHARRCPVLRQRAAARR